MFLAALAILFLSARKPFGSVRFFLTFPIDSRGSNSGDSFFGHGHEINIFNSQLTNVFGFALRGQGGCTLIKNIRFPLRVFGKEGPKSQNQLCIQQITILNYNIYIMLIIN
jgi:hypothetical protein